MSYVKKMLLFFCCSVVLMNCTPNKKIGYSIKDIERIKDERLSQIVFDIEELVDKRKEDLESEILYDNPRKCTIDIDDVCINAEKHYKKSPVARQVTSMLFEHLNKRTSFKKVVVNKKDTADFYITGTLSKFFGKQDFSTSAAVGAQFGLIGALATAGAKTDGKIIFEITNLKIYNKNDVLVKDIGSFKRVYEGEFHADAYCWCIFDNVNAKLKDYFTDLIAAVETEIKNNNYE